MRQKSSVLRVEKQLTFFVNAILILILLVLSTAASAASWPPGTLTYVKSTTTRTSGTCTIITTSWTWTFTDTAGTKHTFPTPSMFTSYISPNHSCYGSVDGPASEWSKDYQFYLVADQANGSITLVGGYVNPKYLILGVTYAPPGPTSFVDYTKSTLVADQTDIKNSFSTGYSVSVQTTISGWLAGSVSGSYSSSYTEASNTSSSVTVSKETSLSDTTPGWNDAYHPINHDYDIVWLWLNPVVRLSFSETNGVVNNLQWNGYGYDAADQPNMDVYPVYIGWLNGDIAIPANVQSILNRGWASTKIWPSGQGPALNSTDFQAIEKSDPYWDCTPNPASCPATVDGTRFTGPVSGENFIYQQAPVGGNPQTQSYTETYINSTTQGQGASYQFQEIFAIERTFGNSSFVIGLSTTTKQQSTLTWTSEWNNRITNTNTSSGELSITGPPCTVINNACNPLYTGSTEFDVYEDNLYGTFLFFPIN